MVTGFIIAYAVIGACVGIASFLWFPWKGDSRIGRAAGAICQAPLWPLALYGWHLIKWERR